MRRVWLAFSLGLVCLSALDKSASAKPRRVSVEQALSVKPPTEPASKRETVVQVLVLHGTHESRASDARIGDMPELREGPFAQYSSYQLLSRTRLPLSRGDTRQLELPNGRRLETQLQDILPDGSSRLVASINRADGKDFLRLLEVKARPGQAFIVAGQSYKRGILVLVFKVLR